MTLIAIGCGEIAHILSISPPPMTAFDLFASVTFLPVIGAGLGTLLKRPVLGAFMGFLAFLILLVWLLGKSSSI